MSEQAGWDIVSGVGLTAQAVRSRAVDPMPAVAESYGRPVTDTPLSTLRSALFITGRSGSGG